MDLIDPTLFLFKMPREGIGPPTPAFSGPRSTTELSRLKANYFYILYTIFLKRKEEILNTL